MSSRAARVLTVSVLLVAALASCSETTDGAARGRAVVFALRSDYGAGSATYVGGGHFVTAAHVVGSATTFRLSQGSKERSAKLVSADFDSDIALMRMENSEPAIAALAWASDLTPGTPILVVGYPAPLDETEPTVTGGVVSSVRQLDGISYLQLDAPINPGNSGGAVITRDGLLAGLVLARVRGSEGLGFALPAAAVRGFRDHPISRGTPVPPATPAASPVATGPRADLIAFRRAWCELGVNSLLLKVVALRPREADGDGLAAYRAQVAYLEVLARTPRVADANLLYWRSELIGDEIRIRDLLLVKAGLPRDAMDQVVSEIGKRYDSRARWLKEIERMEFEYGVTAQDYLPAGGCKVT